jgi:hypothetical protein
MAARSNSIESAAVGWPRRQPGNRRWAPTSGASPVGLSNEGGRVRAAKKIMAVVSTGFAVAALVSVTPPSTSASEAAERGQVRTMLADRLCEQSNDAGENGAEGCFEDRGDNWYACDIDEGGSGIAWVRAWEGPTRHGPWHRRGTELDDNVGSSGCDKGPEVNIDNGSFIKLRICILQNGDRTGCDVLKVKE